MESLIESDVDADIGQLPCNLVNNFTTSWEQCNFIIRNECLEEEALDYVYFNYCIMGSKFKYLSLVIIIFLLLVFFITLGTIADEFLCPNLLKIAKNLKMSENLAGITLLAFGNGSSDIFSSLAAASSGKAELIVSELLGAGIFCLSIVAGLIFIKQDFRLAYRPLLRDTIFYLFSVYFIWFICWNQQITLYYALAFILIYVIYLMVALGGQAIFSRMQQQKQQKLNTQALPQKKIPTVSVEIDHRDHNNSNRQDKQPLSVNQQSEWVKEEEISDWSHGSDWFVQSQNSIRRRRLSKITLTTVKGEDQSLLKDKHSNGVKYGSNKYITSIKIDYKPDLISEQNKNKNQYIKSRGCETKNDRDIDTNNINSFIRASNNHNGLAITGEPTVMRKMSLVAYVKPTFECISKTESLNSFKCNNNLNFAITRNETNMINREDKVFVSTHQNDCENNVHSKSMASEKISVSSDGESGMNIVNIDRISINTNDWDSLLEHINPLQLGDWSGANLTRKLITIVRSPLVFIAICTIPVVDYDKKRSNWCRLLNTFHCISIPLVLLISQGISSSPDTKSLYYAIGLFIIGFALAVFMLMTTQNDKPPKYHVLFSYVGFVMSILWVYTLVTEILGLLKTIGIIFSMSDTAIGLAFLAWGNSLGDIFANLALAEAGYPRMAIGACIGAPLLNLLIGFGLSFAVNLNPSEVVFIEYTPMITLLCLSLAIVISSLMLCTLVPPKFSKRPFGYVLISAYFIYFTLAVLIEFELI